jgi:hypothetical protein
MCLSLRATCVDGAGMTITAEHIFHKTCNMCERPALTFDRDNRAFCPQHAAIFLVMAKPVEHEIPVTARLSG